MYIGENSPRIRLMKILLFIRSLELGGAERQMANLAIELGSRGHQIAVVTMYEGGVLKDRLEKSDPILCECRRERPIRISRS